MNISLVLICISFTTVIMIVFVHTFCVFVKIPPKLWKVKFGGLGCVE